MDRATAKTIFEKLYGDVNGRSISLAGRQAHDYKSKSFVYGEVLFDSFSDILLETNPQPGQVFYDFGSGTGKGVFIAHLMYDYAQSVGVEFVDTLYDSSAEVLKRYETEILPTIKQDIGDKKISFVLGDILDVDVSNIDLIFMNSTCFQDDLMEGLENTLLKMKPGAQIISLSKSLKGPAFEVRKRRMAEFSWGEATVFFQRKLP